MGLFGGSLSILVLSDEEHDIMKSEKNKEYIKIESFFIFILLKI
jgi:hypothetical protein